MAGPLPGWLPEQASRQAGSPNPGAPAGPLQRIRKHFRFKPSLFLANPRGRRKGQDRVKPLQGQRPRAAEPLRSVALWRRRRRRRVATQPLYLYGANPSGFTHMHVDDFIQTTLMFKPPRLYEPLSYANMPAPAKAGPPIRIVRGRVAFSTLLKRFQSVTGMAVHPKDVERLRRGYVEKEERLVRIWFTPQGPAEGAPWCPIGEQL